MSPAIAAITLISIANGSPDLISAFGNAAKINGALIALACLFGGFIFSSCLVVGYVGLSVKDPIKLPKIVLLKELAFYSIAIVILVVAGFLRAGNWILLAVLMTVYVTYITLSILLDKA